MTAKLYNIFAGHVTDEWVDESWAVPSSIDELLDGYRGWHPALLKMLAQVSDCYKWGIRDRDPLPRWTDGGITLLGDAAHPMMPTLAQGAAQALEDGYALARHLMQCKTPARGLVAYEAERRPHTSRVVLQCDRDLARSEVGPEVPADLPDGVDDVLAELLGDGLKLLVAEAVQVLRLVDSVK